MKNSTQLAVCSIITSLTVVLMFFGGATFILAYAVPIIVSLFMIMLKTTFSSSAAWITYASSSALALMLSADRECSMIYVAIFGYYPIIAGAFNRIKPKFLSLIIKLIYFNSAYALCQIILFYVFGVPFIEEENFVVILIALIIMMNILFVIYDRLVKLSFILYKNKFEKRIKHLFK